MNHSDDIFTPPSELVAYLRWQSQRNRALSASVGITLRDMYAESADEIEQLRKDVDFQAKVISRHYEQFAGLHREIERLRKELEVYKDLYAAELLRGKQ